MTEQKKQKEIIQRVILILIVIGIGLFVINQVLSYYYKSQFLLTPCELCLEINNNLELCQKINNINEINLSNITFSTEILPLKDALKDE